MASPGVAKSMNYERVLQAIGRLAQEQRLRDICILEVEGGMVLQGEAPVSTREGYHLTSDTRVLSHDDLKELTRKL